jgi:hypothetical protein
MDKLHYINVRPDGTFRRNGLFPTLPNDVDAIVNTLRDRRKLVIFFHGGLVSESAGMATANALLSTLDDGATRHAVFTIWETGFVETIKAHAVDIIKSLFFSKLQNVVIANVMKHLGGAGKGAPADVSPDSVEPLIVDPDASRAATAVARGGAAAMTEADLIDRQDEITATVEEDLMADGSIASSMQAPDEANGFVHPDVKESVAAAQARGILGSVKLLASAVKVVINVIRRFINHRDHGVHATVVEEILREIYVADVGAAIWGEMKTSAKTMWTSNQGVADGSLFAGRYFLDQIVKLQKENGLLVDLVGHSAGAIAIIEMLAAGEASGFKANHVVFLAPACTLDAFDSVMRQKPELYATFRMFAMHDDLEASDTLVTTVPALYPSSLLYFISGVLENESDKPIVGMQRFSSGKQPYVGNPFGPIDAFLTQAGADRYILSITDAGAGDGLRCASKHHGGFPEEPLMKTSLKIIVSQ